MGRKDKPLLTIDYHTGIGQVIPATQEAYIETGFSKEIRKEESETLKQFKQALGAKLKREIEPLKQFPTNNEIFIFIIQYFISQHEYKSRDVDNMAKTILDVLKGVFYQNDSQVRVLLVAKKTCHERIDQNFTYFAIKELKDDRDMDILKESGLERSVTVYQKLIKQQPV